MLDQAIENFANIPLDDLSEAGPFQATIKRFREALDEVDLIDLINNIEQNSDELDLLNTEFKTQVEQAREQKQANSELIEETIRVKDSFAELNTGISRFNEFLNIPQFDAVTRRSLATQQVQNTRPQTIIQPQAGSTNVYIDIEALDPSETAIKVNEEIQKLKRLGIIQGD